MNVRTPKSVGATLMSKMFPHPQCHAARLRRLGYVPPIWHRALRRAPPKDMYPLKRISAPLKLPGDEVVRKIFFRIPMLRKERYEQFNVDYQPLATRIALTQMRLMREGMTEEAAFLKCERDIFKDELYFFAKGIRDNPGNHFKLTSDELRSFYIHDLINEAQMLKSRVNKALNDVSINPTRTAITTGVVAGTEALANLKQQATDRIAEDTVAKYLVEKEPLINDVMQERGVDKVFVNPFHQPYKITGEYKAPKSTFLFHPDYNVDDIMLYRHGPMFQENQRFIKSQVQVPASAFIDAINFHDAPMELPDPKTYSLNDEEFDGQTVGNDTNHGAMNNSTYFTIQEGLENRVLSRQEKLIDKDIAVLLMKQDKAAAKAAKKAAKSKRDV